MEKASRRSSWVKAHLQAALEKEVEVIASRGDPVYGRLLAFDLDSRPPIIVVASSNSKYFINLERVERLRVAEQSR